MKEVLTSEQLDIAADTATITLNSLYTVDEKSFLRVFILYTNDVFLTLLNLKFVYNSISYDQLINKHIKSKNVYI